MSPKVLISDALSPAAVQIFKDRGVEVDFQPKLGADKDALAQRIGDFDGLATALTEAGLKLEGEADLGSLLQLVGVLLGNDQPGEAEQDVDAVEVGMQIGKSIGSIPTDLLLVGRTLGLLDGITKQLDPNMDTMEIVAHYTE